MSTLKPKTANFFYLITLILLSTIGAYAQIKNIFLGIVITEYGLILFPVVLYLMIKRMDLRSILRLKKISIIQVLLAFLIAVFGWLISESISVIWVFITSKWMPVLPNPIPAPNTTYTFLMEVLTVAFSAALCEELYFRGFFMKAYEECGTKRAIIMSGVFFAFLHMNPTTIPSIIFLGILLAYVVYRTGSIFMSMIIHFTYNLISITMMKLAAGIDNPSASIPFQAIIVWIYIGAFAALILLFFIKILMRNTNPVYNEGGATTGKFLHMSIGHWPMIISIVLMALQIAALFLRNFFGFK